MNLGLGYLWTSIFDSELYRRFANGSTGRAFTHSPAYKQALLRKSYAKSSIMAWRAPGKFQDVHTLCLFIGHNKSGTSLIGSLLDAHADAVVADDMDVLRFVEAGFSRTQICHLLADGARRDYMKGRVTARRVAAYSFLVPGEWQGRYRRAHVIGDSTSGSTTRRLGQDPTLLGRVQALAGEASVRFIFVVRNPYDPISYIMVRGNRSFENAIEHYFTNCATVAKLLEQIEPANVLTVRYETFVTSLESQLRRVCDFLTLEAGEEYIAACGGIVRRTPERNRELVAWEPGWKQAVWDRMQAFDFLEGYSFEN
jgi:hypothetical protein